MSFFERQERADRRLSAALIKKRYTVSDVAEALGLSTEIGDECPACGSLALDLFDHRDLARCPHEPCGRTYDQIDLVRTHKGLGFHQAITWIEEHCGHGAARARDGGGAASTAKQGDLL